MLKYMSIKDSIKNEKALENYRIFYCLGISNNFYYFVYNIARRT